MPSRDDVFRTLLETLRAELVGLERMTQMAIDEATGDESKAENQYDTRGLEASYLARGQAERVVALRRLVGWITTLPSPAESQVGLGSLVELESDEDTRWMVVLPDGGGTRFRVDGIDIRCITPESPIGRDLIGCIDGDDVEIAGVGYCVRCVLSF